MNSDGFGKFITFEGLDGAGKGTQIDKVMEYLSDIGRAAILVREPGGTELSEQIREMLLQNEFAISPMSELLLFLSARAELISKVIRPALESGKDVVCDRYMDSTIAYQGYGRGLLSEAISLNDIATGSLVPDITFFLDISHDECYKRRVSRDKEQGSKCDRLESENDEFHSKVYEGYKILAKENSDRIFIIDGCRDEQKITEDILSILKSRMDR